MAKTKKAINVKYKCLGASEEVTGSCHLINIHVNSKQYNLVVDLGMVQNGLKSMNEIYKINKANKNIQWENILGVILTHAHT